MKTGENKKHIMWLFILPFILLIGCKNNPRGHDTGEPVMPATASYDSVLAAQYGADDYGMKKYVIAFLYRGTNTEIDSAQAMSLQMAHLENIQRMAREGTLVLAGPFFGNDALRGIYIFNVPTLEEAEALTNTDPAIQAGLLRMELKEWYGAAALMAVNQMNEKVTRKSITDSQ